MKATTGLFTLTAVSIALAMTAAHAQVPAQQPNTLPQQQQGYQPPAAMAFPAPANNGTLTGTTRRNGQPRVEVSGQALIDAENIVATARGDCRSWSNQPAANGVQKTRLEKSTAYQSCMSQKRAGTPAGANSQAPATLR